MSNAQTSCSDVVFAFGPNGAFFLEYGEAWEGHNLPHGMNELFYHSGPGDAVSKTFSLGFTDTGGYLVVYETDGGEIRYREHRIPLRLSGWLRNSRPDVDGVINLKTLRFAFGQGQSFFASATNTAGQKLYRWQNLHPNVEEHVQRAVATRSTYQPDDDWRFTFGARSSCVLYPAARDGVEYFYAQKDCNCPAWGLVEQMKGGETHGSLIVMNPYNPTEFFFLRADGSAKWGIHQQSFHAILNIAMLIRRDRAQITEQREPKPTREQVEQGEQLERGEQEEQTEPEQGEPELRREDLKTKDLVSHDEAWLEENLESSESTQHEPREVVESPDMVQGEPEGAMESPEIVQREPQEMEER